MTPRWHQRDTAIRSPEMPRRTFLAAIAGGLLAAPLAAEAQPGKTSRIGFLVFSSASAYSARLAEHRQSLADLGWVEGHNLIIEQRSAENENDRLPVLAAELLRADVKVIVAENAAATRAAMQATSTVPIVMAGVGDAVRYGLIANLARPGGNVTGLSVQITEMLLKNLELLKEAAPRTARVAFLANPSNPWCRPLGGGAPAGCAGVGTQCDRGRRPEAG